MQLPQKELLRVDEVADYFRKSERTVRRWVADGKLENCIKVNNSIRIPLKSLFDSDIIRFSSDCYQKMA